MERVARRLLAVTGLLPVPAPEAATARFARVTRTITARSRSFGFTRPWRGGEVVPRAGTLLALDGEEEVRTPHDDCLLVMPNLLPQQGQTALRLAAFG